tara:strand:- start:262 stop:399 length:138 start_codon:yes stop_codon:yes gene_type:complete
MKGQSDRRLDTFFDRSRSSLSTGAVAPPADLGFRAIRLSLFSIHA